MRLFIFDVGGVFRDSSKAMTKSLRLGFQRGGLSWPFKTEDIWHLRGIGKYNNSRNCIKALLALTRAGKGLRQVISQPEPEKALDRLVADLVSRSNDPLVDEIRAKYKQFFYSQQAAPLIRLYTKVKEAIELLHKAGYKLAIWTNTSVSTVKRDLAKLDLTLFSYILGGEDTGLKKPSGAGILEICKKLKIPPAQAAYVGDCPIDIQAAKDAGCKSIALLGGQGLEIHLKKEKPDWIFADLWEMARYFSQRG